MAQFYAASKAVVKREAQLLQRLPGTPGNSFTYDILEALDELNVGQRVHTLRRDGLAAQWRCINGTSQSFWRMQEMLNRHLDPDDLEQDRLLHASHRAWISKHSIMAQCMATHTKLTGMGIRVPNPEPVTRKCKLQLLAAKALATKVRTVSPVAEVARKIHLHTQINVIGSGVDLAKVLRAAARAKPSFASALLKAWVNGWCFQHRFGGGRARCKWGCGHPAGDTMCHTAECPTIMTAIEGLAPILADFCRRHGPAGLLCIIPGMQDELTRALSAILQTIHKTYEYRRAKALVPLNSEDSVKLLIGSINIAQIRLPREYRALRSFRATNRCSVGPIP